MGQKSGQNPLKNTLSHKAGMGNTLNKNSLILNLFSTYYKWSKKWSASLKTLDYRHISGIFSQIKIFCENFIPLVTYFGGL